jgi:hypothetical protein
MRPVASYDGRYKTGLLTAGSVAAKKYRATCLYDKQHPPPHARQPDASVARIPFISQT